MISGPRASIRSFRHTLSRFGGSDSGVGVDPTFAAGVGRGGRMNAGLIDTAIVWSWDLVIHHNVSSEET